MSFPCACYVRAGNSCASNSIASPVAVRGECVGEYGDTQHLNGSACLQTNRTGCRDRTAPYLVAHSCADSLGYKPRDGAPLASPLAHGQLGRPTNWAGPPVQAGMVLVAETWSSNSEDEAARTPANPNEALHQHESPHPNERKKWFLVSPALPPDRVRRDYPAGRRRWRWNDHLTPQRFSSSVGP